MELGAIRAQQYQGPWFGVSNQVIRGFGALVLTLTLLFW